MPFRTLTTNEELLLLRQALAVGVGQVPVFIERIDESIYTGDFFLVSYKMPDDSPLGDNDSLDVLLLTNTDKASCLILCGACGGDAEMLVFEAPDVQDPGTSLDVFSPNRVTPGETTATASHTPTLADDGDQLEVVYIPGGTGGQTMGNRVVRQLEWVLKPDTYYLFRMTNRAGTAQPASLRLQWCEA